MFRTAAAVTRTSVRTHTRGDGERQGMETLDPHTLGSIVVSSGVAFAMVWLGTRMNLLEERRETRCPACGIIRRHGRCGCTDADR